MQKKNLPQKKKTKQANARKPPDYRLKSRKLQAQLTEAQDTLRAISNGEVDAFVVHGKNGEQVFTLKNAEHPYRMMVESMNEGAATLLADGTIIYCNEQFADLICRPALEIPGLKVDSFIAHSSQRAFNALFQVALTRPSKAEVFFCTSDGSIIATHVSLAMVNYDGSQVLSMIVTDLTEQKQNEALIVSEKLTRSILEQVAEAIVVCDENGLIIRANPAAHMLAEVNLFSKLFNDAFSLYDGDGKRFTFIPHEHLHEVTKGLSLNLSLSEGKFFSLSVSISHLRNSDVGLGFVITLTDITQIQRFEAALIYQNHVTETIASNAASCLIMLNEQGFPTFMNRSAEIVTGYKLAELSGKPVRRMLSYEVQDGAKKSQSHFSYFSGAELTERQSGVEHIFVRKNGQKFPISYSISPLVTNKKNSGAVLEFRDITDQKRADQELKAAKEAAEMASQLKTAFLSNMSHEIRTPLAAIIGFTELLKDESIKSKERAEYLEIISRSGKSLTRLIDDILDISKVEAGRLDFEMISFSLTNLVEEVMAMFSIKAKEKNIDLTHTVARDVPKSIRTDPTRLRQILVNIIGNAVKFTDKGSVHLDIFCGIDHLGENQIHFRVTDTGPGLAPEKAVRLFESFSQGDNSTTRLHGGTGLGLVLSRKLARIMGGDVKLDRSEMGVGSVFSIRVSYKEALRENFSDWPLQTTLFDGFEAEEQIENHLSDLKVLVVEDVYENQILLEQVLKKLGAEVYIAKNGREGVNEALAQEFDVVLMDIQMPVLDGYGATRELRAQGFSKPIIALTAYAMEEEKQRCVRAGCDGHLSKPIETMVLLETIRRVMSSV